MPDKLSITAQVPAKEAKGDKPATPQLGPVTISVTTGKTAKELIELFGDEAVLTNATANWTVTLQGNVRSGLKKGETQETLQARLGGAKMGVASKGVKVDPVDAYRALFQGATPQEQQKMLQDLQKRAAGK